ncbi:MAG TPA: 16S rRNA (guanine(527)-N(7))-methyltransferase RsmG [Solirubrobacterales bacterium]|nr:16S rRNA (guanine(527)-N(7))-methyltransferase RsmG [Solirubrobacterales bacterium]
MSRLTQLIAGWPGLVSKPDPDLVADSLVLLPHLAGAARLVDVGSGGGLPGLALKIAKPELQVVLVEANRRKAAFLVRAAAELGLWGVDIVGRRAEDAGHDPDFREAFDVATARALAPMPVLAELCLPLVRVGGRLLAMKTAGGEEVAAAEVAVKLLGGRLASVLQAPSAARERGEIVVVDKIAPTPPEYPRRPGVPARRPLGK